MTHRKIIELLPNDAMYHIEWLVPEEDPEANVYTEYMLKYYYHPQGVSGCDGGFCYIGNIDKNKFIEILELLSHYGLIDSSMLGHDSVKTNSHIFIPYLNKYIDIETYIDVIEEYGFF